MSMGSLTTLTGRPSLTGSGACAAEALGRPSSAPLLRCSCAATLPAGPTRRSNRRGIHASKVGGTGLRGCDMSGFLEGAHLNEGCRGVTIRGGRFHDNLRDGVRVEGSSGVEDNGIVGAEADGNGQDGAVHSAEIKVATSLRTDNATDAVLEGNLVRAVKPGGIAYSLGSTTAYGEVRVFRDNRAAPGITFRSGVDPLPGG